MVFKGRAGNQFFQYAFARKLQEITHIDRFVFDFSELGINKSIGKTGSYGYLNVLDSFNVKPYEYVDEGIKYHGDIITTLQYIIYRLRRKLCSTIGFQKSLVLERYDSRLLQSLGIYCVSASNCKDLICLPNLKRRHILIRGFFEASALYDDMTDLLRNELSCRHVLKPDIKGLVNVLKNNNSICVSVRRGDFTSDAYKDQFLVCDIRYYQNGVDYIVERYPDAVVLVCSDDVDWCKDHLHFKTDNVLFEPEGLIIDEKVEIMKACHHFVISNSTFSFWTQYLGNAPDKIVIAPAVWRNVFPPVKDIYMSNWKVL